MAFVTAAIVYVSEVEGHANVFPVIAPGMEGVPGRTVMFIGSLVADGLVVHSAFDVITTVTMLPSVNPEVVYVELFVPTLLPFTFHWYVGLVPSFTGVAVKVTDSPGHISVSEEVMETDGVKIGLTTIGIALLVAVRGDAHSASDVTITLILSPLTGVYESSSAAVVDIVVHVLPPLVLLCHSKVGATPP